MAFGKLSPLGPQAPKHVPTETVELEMMVGKLGILAHAGYFSQPSRQGSSKGQV